jgi:hypothetical protein
MDRRAAGPVATPPGPACGNVTRAPETARNAASRTRRPNPARRGAPLRPSPAASARRPSERATRSPLPASQASALRPCSRPLRSDRAEQPFPYTSASRTGAGGVWPTICQTPWCRSASKEGANSAISARVMTSGPEPRRLDARPRRSRSSRRRRHNRETLRLPVSLVRPESARLSASRSAWRAPAPRRRRRGAGLAHAGIPCSALKAVRSSCARFSASSSTRLGRTSRPSSSSCSRIASARSLPTSPTIRSG